MSNTLSGANKSKSSTGGTITKTPTGLVHTAKPTAAKPKAAKPKAAKPKASNPAAPKASNPPAPAAGAPSKELTKAWIQFLKNNQVVATQSDPKTGKLSYKKKVTTDMLTKFLKTNTHLDDETINGAIETVISKKGPPSAPKPGTPPAPAPAPKPGTPPAPAPKPGTPPAPAPKPGTPPAPAPKPGTPPAPAPKPGTPPAPAPKPGTPPAPAPKPGTPPAPAPKPAKPKSKEEIEKDKRKSDMMKVTGGQGLTRNGNGTLGVTIDDPDDPTGETSLNLTYDDNYNIIDKKKYRNVPDKDTPATGLVEEFIDKPTEIDEKGVEKVFTLLQSKISDAEINTGTDVAPTAEVEPEEQLDKIKNIIKRMSPEQRKSLWQALNDTTLTEQALDKDDIRDIFIQVSKPGFSRKRVDIKDLQQAWKDTGYTDDSEKIVRILKSFGYDSDARDKVFSTVFGRGENDRDSSESNSGSVSKAIDIIMDHVNKSGLKKDLIAFMQKEYGEELSKEEEPGWLDKAAGAGERMFGRAADLGKKIFGRKVTTEEVKQIFTAIVLEKRTMQNEVIREHEYNSLGRNKKVDDTIIDESVTLSDVLKSDQYIKILRHMKTKTGTDINVTRIKNQIIQSWKSGKKHSKHYAGLLSQIHLNIHDLIK
jgi:hypothetical protein